MEMYKVKNIIFLLFFIILLFFFYFLKCIRMLGVENYENPEVHRIRIANRRLFRVTMTDF